MINKSAIGVGLLLLLGIPVGSALADDAPRRTTATEQPGEPEAPRQVVFDQFIGGTLTNGFFAYGPTGADPLNNRAFPDAGAIYWAAVFVRPQGATVEIEGVYPYSRFMSFISYDKAGLFVDGTADYMIDPDQGSVNTYRNGAKRHETPEDKRKYTFEIRLQKKPADLPLVQNDGQPARNYLYSLPSKNVWLDKQTGNPVETILYRIYIPDCGFDYAGGLPVPTVKLTLKDGTVLRGRAAFDASDAEMRFWSISLSESQATTRVGDGAFDEEFPVNADGYISFVASSKQDRPKFATIEHGAVWVNWSLRGDGAGTPNFGWLSIRNMLPKPGTTDNFFAFKRPGDERQVLGEHYPQLKYDKDAAAFDVLGPGGAATQAAMTDIPTKDSPKAIGWPYTAK
jgi:hypothetical protein